MKEGVIQSHHTTTVLMTPLAHTDVPNRDEDQQPLSINAPSFSLAVHTHTHTPFTHTRETRSLLTLIVSMGKMETCSATPAAEPAIMWCRKEPLSGVHSSQSSSIAAGVVAAILSLARSLLVVRWPCAWTPTNQTGADGWQLMSASESYGAEPTERASCPSSDNLRG